MSGRVLRAAPSPCAPQNTQAPAILLDPSKWEVHFLRERPKYVFDLKPKRKSLWEFSVSAVTLFSFKWLDWGDPAQKKSVAENTIQEVANFAIISALVLSLVVGSGTTMVQGLDYLPKQILGVIMTFAVGSLMISLLSSTFLIMFLQEVPEGRAAKTLIDKYMSTVVKIPGATFMIGVYSFAASLVLWNLSTFDLQWSLTTQGLSLMIVSVVLFSSVVPITSGLHEVMSSYGIAICKEEASAIEAVEYYIDNVCDGELALYVREKFLDWTLEQLNCYEFSTIGEIRLVTALDKWEKKVAEEGRPEKGKRTVKSQLKDEHKVEMT